MNDMTPRQAERRERILKTVRDHLSRYGYEGLSMRDVAESAGVSPTTLYNLFQNKDGLILAAQEDVLARVASSVRSTRTSGLARLIASAEAIAEQVVTTPRYAEAMARMLFNSSPADPICRMLLGDVIRQSRNRLQEMQTQREIRRDLDLDLIARILAGDSWSTIMLWMKGFIALQDFRQEYLRRLLMTLAPMMTPQALRRYREQLQGSAQDALRP
jgi:TetR/AcrR family transcriptional regulator, cholesterol catabolism regulator